jgi:hypothetical protein
MVHPLHFVVVHGAVVVFMTGGKGGKGESEGQQNSKKKSPAVFHFAPPGKWPGEKPRALVDVSFSDVVILPFRSKEAVLSTDDFLL